MKLSSLIEEQVYFVLNNSNNLNNNCNNYVYKGIDKKSNINYTCNSLDNTTNKLNRCIDEKV